MGHSIDIEWYNFWEWIESLDITYNLSEMYYLAIKNAWLEEMMWEHKWSLGWYLNWKKMKDLKEFLIKLRNELESNPIEYKKLNPKNGWWSYDWLLKNLNKLIVAANECPECILHDWY